MRDAWLRTEFNITTGPKTADMAKIKFKSAMKEYYTKNGYYPFVFRFTSKRNRCTLENYPDRKRGAKNKGWHVIGGLPNDVKIDSNGCVMFRTSPLEDWHHLGNDLISHSYEAKFVVGAKGSDEKMYIPWRKRS